MTKDTRAMGTTIIRHLTAKSRTTIPLPVRTALGIGPGDAMVYHIRPNGSVVLTKGVTVGEDPFCSFEEWNSEADRVAYARL